MVRTRSKARQEATQSSPLKSPVVEETSVLKPAATNAASSGKKAKERTKPESPPSVEELALRALHVMKKRLGTESRDCSQGEDLGSAESTSQPDVMMLESKPKPSSSKISDPSKLASSLQPYMKEKPYFSFRQEDILASASKPHSSWEDTDRQLMARSVITSDFEKRETAPPIYTSRYARAKARKAAREKSTGKNWYEMEAPQLTPELQNDLRLLKMRSSLNPSQHYKATDWKKLPRYFQVGKVVSGPAEFFSGRVPRKQRKKTIVEELLDDHQFRKYHKNKYLELQKKFASGTKRRRLIKHRKNYKK